MNPIAVVPSSDVFLSTSIMLLFNYPVNLGIAATVLNIFRVAMNRNLLKKLLSIILCVTLTGILVSFVVFSFYPSYFLGRASGVFYLISFIAVGISEILLLSWLLSQFRILPLEISFIASTNIILIGWIVGFAILIGVARIIA